MKKLLLLSSLALSMGMFAQNGRGIHPAVFNQGTVKHNTEAGRIAGGHNQVTNATCTDTLRYVLNKQASLWNGTGAWSSNFNTFNCYADDAEQIAQTFHQTGGSVVISGVEFYGNNDATNGNASVGVQVVIYNVNASDVPTTVLGTGNATITATTGAYQYVSLSTPVTVTGNYAVAIKPVNAGDVLEYFVSSAATGEPMDGENLAHYKSNYYPNSGGNWVTIPVLTNDATNFTSTYDFEPLISPIVSYNITSSLALSPSPVCAGSAVTVTSTEGPSGVLTSPMYTFGAFQHHFNLQPADSTLAWDMVGGLTNVIWNTNTSYTYSTAGTYTATLYTIGGFSHTCLDQATATITVNAVPSNAFSFSSGNSYCAGGSNPTPTATSPGGTWNPSAGLMLVSVVTGQVNLTSTAPGTYTLTYAASGACASGSSSVAVTVNANPTVTYNTLQTSACNADPNITLTGATPAGGTYSGTGVTGGTFAPSTATPGTYTVTYSYTDANGCSGSATDMITVNANPTVSYTTLPATACVTDADITLTGATPAGGNYSGTGVTAGMFSPSTAGAGTYAVTYSYTDPNGCSGTASSNITVSNCVGLKNVNTTSTIEMYPNPATNEVSFTLGNNVDKGEVSIVALDGKVVYKSCVSANKGTIDVSNMARGIYFVRLKAGNNESIAKLVLN